MMRVFISWSGTVSQNLALALRDWLPIPLPAVEPWVSTADIRTGARWTVELASILEETVVGILCVDPSNLLSPWLNFEAGALSRVLEARVIPVLYGLEPSDLAPPLSQFQAVSFDEQGLLKLVTALDQLNPGGSLGDEKVRRAFKYSWANLLASIDEPIAGKLDSQTPAHSEQKRSTPDDSLREVEVELLKVLAEALEQNGKFPFLSLDTIARRLSTTRIKSGYFLQVLEAKGMVFGTSDIAPVAEPGQALFTNVVVGELADGVAHTPLLNTAVHYELLGSPEERYKYVGSEEVPAVEFKTHWKIRGKGLQAIMESGIV